MRFSPAHLTSKEIPLLEGASFAGQGTLTDEALFHFSGSVDGHFSLVDLYHSGLSRRYSSTLIRQVWCGVPFTILKISGLYFLKDVTINKSGNTLCGIGTVS